MKPVGLLASLSHLITTVHVDLHCDGNLLYTVWSLFSLRFKGRENINTCPRLTGKSVCEEYTDLENHPDIKG